MTPEEKIITLIGLAKKRHPVIVPLPTKEWMDCIDVQRSADMVILHYHVPNDKSSKAVYIKLED